MLQTYSAGFRKIDINDAGLGISFPVHVYYPTNQPEALFKIGPFPVKVAVDAPLSQGAFPLIIFSHGSGSLPVLFRTLGRYLAQQGFIVAMPEHPFNNRHDNSGENTLENLQNRPRHIKLLADWLFNSDVFSTGVVHGHYAMIGHSMGGYTALALAGGKPSSVPNDSTGDMPIETVKDQRIKSIILITPATPWFRLEGALTDIQVPVLMYTGNEDKIAAAAFHGKIVLDGLRGSRVQHIAVPQATHFSFMSPYPEELKSPTIPPSQDLPGFDRQALLDKVYPEIAEFVRENIK